MLTEPELMRQIVNHRKALLAYVLTIVRNYHLAEDVFQDVCVVLARRRTEFTEIPDFWRLARGIAKRQALAALRKSKRHAPMSPEVMAQLEEQFDASQSAMSHVEQALAACIEQLPESWGKIVRLRYWGQLSVAAIAVKLGKTANSVSVTMNRVKSALAECIRVAGEANGEMPA